MPILRLLVLVLTGTIGGITLMIAVAVLLGVAWLAVAVPTLVVVGLLAGAVALWHRLRGALRKAPRG